METIFVLKDVNAKDDESCYVDIDRSSGGYPFLTDLINAHYFYSKERANEYRDLFKNKKWVLQKLIYHATDCEGE